MFVKAKYSELPIVVRGAPASIVMFGSPLMVAISVVPVLIVLDELFELMVTAVPVSPGPTLKFPVPAVYVNVLRLELTVKVVPVPAIVPPVMEKFPYSVQVLEVGVYAPAVIENAPLIVKAEAPPAHVAVVEASVNPPEPIVKVGLCVNVPVYPEASVIPPIAKTHSSPTI